MTQETVAVVNEPGAKQQWGKGLFYRRQGPKDVLQHRSVTILLLILFVPALLWSLLFEQDTDDSGEQTTIRLRGDITGITRTIDLPFFHENNVPSERATKPTISSSGAAKQRFSGLALIPRSSAHNIPPGTIGQATLVSGASNGPVRATLSAALKWNGDVLLPAGTALVGRGASTEERLFVGFKQAVLKDGTVVGIEAQACDASDQTVGLKGSLVGYRTLKLGAAAGLNFAAGISQGLQDTRGQGGVEVRTPSTKNALLNGASTAALEESRDLMSDLKSKPPIIEVEAGTGICILFAGDGS